MSTVKIPTFTFDLTQIQVVSFQCNHFFLFKTTRTSNMGLKLSYNMQVSADIQYFAVSIRVYFLTNNVGIHFVFTYYFPYFLLTSFSTGTHVQWQYTLFCCLVQSKWTKAHFGSFYDAYNFYIFTYNFSHCLRLFISIIFECEWVVGPSWLSSYRITYFVPVLLKMLLQ